MRQHIDTAPVWGVYGEDCECPLCLLAEKVETANVDYFLGESVMEPDQRIEVNEKGFCKEHFKKLYDAGNRLGLGLMTHTYLKETLRKNEKSFAEIARAAKAEAGKPVYKRMGPKKGKEMSEIVVEMAKSTQTCVLCERLHNNMERYIYTVLYMYKHEAEFPQLMKKSKGLCLEHFYEMLEQAPKHLSGELLDQFTEMLLEVEKKNLERMEAEIEWFTLKFDYRNEDKPWGNSRDAVKRTVNKLRGRVIDEKA